MVGNNAPQDVVLRSLEICSHDGRIAGRRGRVPKHVDIDPIVALREIQWHDGYRKYRSTAERPIGRGKSSNIGAGFIVVEIGAQQVGGDRAMIHSSFESVLVVKSHEHLTKADRTQRF